MNVDNCSIKHDIYLVMIPRRVMAMAAEFSINYTLETFTNINKEQSQIETLYCNRISSIGALWLDLSPTEDFTFKNLI